MTRALFTTQADPYDLPPRARRPGPPALSWFEARETGRRLMAEQARLHGFTIHAEGWLTYDAGRRLYRYDVCGSRDVNNRNGNIRVHFDADSGAQRGIWPPTGKASGDTIGNLDH